MPDSNHGDVFDEERLSRLVDLMKEHGLSEVELRDAEQQIRICRPTMDGAVPYSPQYAPVAPAPPPAAAGGAPASAPAAEESDSIVTINSPMVGTFYSKPNPNAPPFVKVGDHVDPETTICIIEAMKVFNEIPAEVRGKVVAVLVEEEEAVEFGKPMYKVDTNG